MEASEQPNEKWVGARVKMDETAAHARTAAERRKEVHRAIAQRDLVQMRQAIAALYIDEDSPLHGLGELQRVETYAPMVEAAIVARIHAGETELCRETALNLRHTHAAFQVPTEDYEAIEAQLAQLDAEDADAHAIDWCAGTCLHGKVKPFRHERLFRT